jgi:hypothetical protein
MSRGDSFGKIEERGRGGDAVAPLPPGEPFLLDENEDDASCVQCGAEAPLNGAELCEECHDEEQAQLLECWREGNA